MKSKSSNIYPEQSGPLTSSKLVVWDGPTDIGCLNICRGDSITEVIYKQAQLFCELASMLNLEDLDLTGLFEGTEPAHTLANILELIISNINELNNQPGAFEQYVPPTYIVPEAIRYNDENGDPVVELSQEDYITYLGQLIAQLRGDVDNNTTVIAELNDRITALEEAEIPTYELPSIISEVIGDAPTTHPLDEVVAADDAVLASYMNTLGSIIDIQDAIATQCEGLASSNQLGNETCAAMSSLAGWVDEPSTEADTIKNLWLTVCDMRTAIENLKNCCKVTCRDVIFDFLPVLSNNGGTLTLYFQGYSVIPEGFIDCEGSPSELTITDADGTTYTITVPVSVVNDTSVVIDLSTSGLSIESDYTLSFTTCLTNGVITCDKTIVKTVVNNVNFCVPVTVYPTDTSVVYFFTPNVLNLDYTIQLFDSTGTTLVDSVTYTVTSPGVVTGSFTGLTGGTAYKVRLQVWVTGDTPIVCNFINTTTTGGGG